MPAYAGRTPSRNKNSNKTNEKIVEIANQTFGRNKQINKNS